MLLSLWELMFRPCILIPTYNNPDTIPDVLVQLQEYQLPIILVDDGSEKETASLLKHLAHSQPGVDLVVREKNGGKGAAVQTGLRRAIELSFSHALQMDADGQHSSRQIPEFLDAASSRQDALVLGTPVFGDDVPKSRLYGRQVSRVMVWLQTLSFQIGDPLFGFRVYPLTAVATLLERTMLGNRMDFDPEIAVRLCWQGVPVVNVKATVCYPDGNVSHFQMVRDNFRLSWLHTRLFAGMLLRSPLLLARKFR